MATLPLPRYNHRLGFTYFPDDLHYRDSDLEVWLPQVQSLGAAWMVLAAPPNRAIPEKFIKGLLDAGIEPILHFHLPLDPPPAVPELKLLFDSYARWGARYAVLFDRPNVRSSWQASSWAQKDLVERFLDHFIPFAEAAQAAGLTPVFPPLEPGGDYWDTAFLRGALQGMHRRGYTSLLDSLVLSAYAFTGNKRLDWGAGGPERWPLARPYDTPAGSEDQRGFRIFEWYLALARTVVRREFDILLVGAGARPGDFLEEGSAEPLGEITPAELNRHARRNIALARLLEEEDPIPDPEGAAPDGESPDLEPVPPQVVACCFWLLSAAPGSPYARDAWFRSDGTTLPVVGSWWQWLARRSLARQTAANPANDAQPVFVSHLHPGSASDEGTLDDIPGDFSADADPEDRPLGVGEPLQPQPKRFDPASPGEKLIAHYLLLPSYDWGVSDWHLEVIRPYVRQFRPTIGYSLEEAMLAKRVTVIGGPGSFAAEKISTLRSAGCLVDEIGGDGTDIASQLANLVQAISE